MSKKVIVTTKPDRLPIRPLTDKSSGIEPVFAPHYVRRKITPEVCKETSSLLEELELLETLACEDS